MIRSTGGAAGTFSLGGDIPVNRLGYGTMQLTGPGAWGEPADPAAALRLLRRAVDLGVNLIDTADSYGPRVAETLIADALHPYPADLVIATKGGLVRPGPGKWRNDGSPERLRQCVEDSLRRLRLERIDLYQLHEIDPDVPAEDQFEVLADLSAEGKIRHVGLSEVDIPMIERARRIVPIATVQNVYNLHDRDWDQVIDYCQDEGIGFIPWFPLSNGELARTGGPLTAAAGRLNATPPQIALAWLLHRSPAVLPIPGTADISHLEENMDAASLELSPAEYEALSSEVVQLGKARHVWE